MQCNAIFIHIDYNNIQKQYITRCIEYFYFQYLSHILMPGLLCNEINA